MPPLSYTICKSVFTDKELYRPPTYRPPWQRHDSDDQMGPELDFTSLSWKQNSSFIYVQLNIVLCLFVDTVFTVDFFNFFVSPQSLLTGMNKFLESLNITFRRDPTNFRPRINKLNSVKVFNNHTICCFKLYPLLACTVHYGCHIDRSLTNLSPVFEAILP